MKKSILDKFFEVHSPCGRAWSVPVRAVRDDYAKYLAQVDNLTMQDAITKANSSQDFLENWFTEQMGWSEIEAYGTLIREAAPDEIKRALDMYRASAYPTICELTHRDPNATETQPQASAVVGPAINPAPEALVCSICGELQFPTPSGDCCKNGHGGVDGVPYSDFK